MTRSSTSGSLTALLVLALPLSAKAQSASPATVELVHNDAAARVDVVVDGRPFTSYIYPPDLKKPVLYPIRAASGKVVTRGWPLEPRAGERMDHPHQLGLWFSYESVNGLDFWNNSTAIDAADAPRMGTIVHRAVRSVRSGRGEGVLETTSEWVNHQGDVLLREDTRFVFGADRDHRVIDRLTTLTARDDTIRFEDIKDGLLGLRVRRELEHPSNTPDVFTDAAGRATEVPVLANEGVTGKYHSSEGVDGEAVWGTRARWVILQGIVEGETVTIAVLDHPANVGFPTYWHARGYGLFAANPLGQRIFSNGEHTLDFRLAPRQSGTFRHRVLILEGPVGSEEIERRYGEWARGRPR